MTCIRIEHGYVCVEPWGRLHVKNKYVWVSFHTYCGPAFFKNSAMTEEYEVSGVDDPVWPEFDRWKTKYDLTKAKSKR